MNLVVVCSGCGAVYRVLQGDLASSDVDHLVGSASAFWPNGYVCPKCNAQASGGPEESLPRSIQTTDIIDMSAEEFHAALYGLGLPDERVASIEEVSRVLSSGTVKRVVGEDVTNTKRCTIDFIEMSDGSRIYLGASIHGAVVYRVVNPAAYARRVLEESDGSCV
jgi:rubredoxin